MNSDKDRLSSYKSSPVNSWGKFNVKLKATSRKFISSILDTVRKSAQYVYITPPYARGGNWLYVWTKAYAENGADSRYMVKYVPGMDAWVAEFPKLKNLTYYGSKIPFTWRRGPGIFQVARYAEADGSLQKFINQVVLDSASFAQRRKSYKSLISEDTLVINVRRGDYYSDPRVKSEYGLDTVEYISAAVRHEQVANKFTKIFIVSDDIDWCKKHLSFLENHTHNIMYNECKNSIFDDLAALSVARKLVVTNTTFGYWGAYIAEIAEGCLVVAPAKHKLDEPHDEKRRPMQHGTSWHYVNNLPGGWWE